MIMRLLAGVVLGVLVSGDAIAGAVEDCAAASNRQDYAEALRLCRPLAEQGEAAAQTTLGSMYEDGLGGLEQDEAEAVSTAGRLSRATPTPRCG
jgi:TPR repeat protein